MKKLLLIMSIAGVLLNTSLQAAPKSSTQSSLQNDVKTVFQKVASNDYKGMSTILNKYSDATSIKTILTAKGNGQTLLHAVANLADTATALKMGILIANRGLDVSPQFQKQIISVKDNKNKTPIDYAKGRNNQNLLTIFNNLVAIVQSSTASTSGAMGSTSTGSTGAMSTGTTAPSTTSTSASSTPAPAPASTLQSDINAAFVAVRAGDYNGLKALLKKYSDTSSIKTMLTAVEISLVATGQTLLHKASALTDLNTALKMGILIVNKASEVNIAFQAERILAKDVGGKTPFDYATSNGNTQLVSIFSSIAAPTPTPAPAPASTLQDDVNAAFQAIAAGDYMGMSKLVKKYTDATSVQTMLTAVQNGKTLLQAAVNVNEPSTVAMMVGRITGQAMQVGKDFQVQIIKAQDSQGMSAIDYAKSKGNTQVVDLLTQMSSQ
jgi:ankyrin repeat protein